MYYTSMGSQTTVMVQRELSTLGTNPQIRTCLSGKGGTGASPSTHPTLETNKQTCIILEKCRLIYLNFLLHHKTLHSMMEILALKILICPP